MKTGWLALLGSLAAGCSGISASNPPDGGADGSNGDAASDSAPESAADSSVEAGVISITLGGCSAFTPCGGDVTGTWNLAAGCIDDPLATSKSLCPALVVNSETANASGSVTFLGGIVTRAYTTHYAMDVTVPPACLTVYDCAQIQAGYQQYIPNTSCATDTSGACRCTGSIDSSAQQGSTYTTANDEIVTGGGDHYAYCVAGNTLQYKHTSGPSPEIGSYTLQK